MTDTRVDVAIIGGGMVGASLAIALAGTGVSTLLVEGTPPGSQSQPSFDDRTTALGNSSRRIFQGLGVWDRLAAEAAAIRTIHVSDAGRFGFARLVASEQGIDAFGYVIPNRVIGAALWEKLRDAKGVLLRVPARPEQVEVGTDAVTFRIGDESVSARLVVAADGAHSVVRSAAGIDADVEDYDQIAVVANVAADRPQDGTAYERFTESGPLAVLPLRDGSYGVVWTCTPARAAEVLSFDDNTYLRELQERFGWRAGRFVRAGVRASYPLKLTRATTTVAARTVLIGNAAQALHPVAGQGFNLGLRDAAMLAEVIVGAFASARADGSPRGVGPMQGAGRGHDDADANIFATAAMFAADSGGGTLKGGAAAGGGGDTLNHGAAAIAGGGTLNHGAAAGAGGSTLNGGLVASAGGSALNNGTAAGAGGSTLNHGAAAGSGGGALNDDLAAGAGGGTLIHGAAAGAGGDTLNHHVDVGSPELLRQFAAWRETDRRGVVGFTDGLVKTFASTRPGVGMLRNLGLLLFDLTPPAKSALSRVSAGFGGPTPRLARGLRLT